MSGRRAAFGVSVKNARRNKKRTFFLVALIGLPVLVAVMAAAVIRASYISPEEQVLTEYGSANVKVEIGWVGREASEWVHDTVADIDPDAEIIEYRAGYSRFVGRQFGRVIDLDLTSPLAEGILTLTTGRAPEATDEVVLTEHLADLLGAGIEDEVSFSFPWGDRRYEVVGLASHPVLWKQTDIVVTPEELDTAEPEVITRWVLASTDDDVGMRLAFDERWQKAQYEFYPDDVEWPMPPDLADWLDDYYYAAMTEDQLAEARSIRDTEGMEAARIYVYEQLFPNGVSVSLPEVYAESRTERLSWTPVSVSSSPPVMGTAVAAILLAEVAFIAAAAFAAGTRRRLREIGLLGANGASTAHIKATVVGEGLVAGLVGSVLASAGAWALLLAGRPVLQRFVDRRIGEFPLTVLDLVGPITVAVISCVIAAWLPAKTASFVPTLTALQGRMPASEPKRWVVPAGLVITGFGTLLFAVGLAAGGTGGGSGAGAVAVIGVVLMIGGVALLAGPLVAWVSRLAEWFPVTLRIVLRDSGRQRARAAAAVAATMVILLVPVAALAGLESNEAGQRIYGLPETKPQLILEGRYAPDSGNLSPYEPGDIDLIRAAVPEAEIAEFTALDVPVQYPAEWAATRGGRAGVVDGNYYISPYRVAVANETLLSVLGDPRLDQALERDGMVLIGMEERATEIGLNGEGVEVAEVPVEVHRFSFPRVLVTEEVAESFDGFESRPMALAVAEPTLLSAFVSPFDKVYYNDSNLSLSGGGVEPGPGLIIGMVFVATLLVVLIVVATVTALSAAEADVDLETVVAVGAPNSIRRRYLGLQSYLHTLFGSLLAVPLALLLVKTASTAVGSYQSLGNFGTFDSSRLYMPWTGIVVLLVGLPLVVGLLTVVTVRSAPLTPPRRAT